MVVALLALALGGCKKETKEESTEPPSIPKPVESLKAPDSKPTPPTPAEPKAPPDAKMDPGGAEKGSVSQSEIETFAQIQAKTLLFEKRITQKAKKGASQAELQELQGQMQQQAEQIVRESGLTQERYKEIARATQRDPNLLRQVQKVLQKVLQKEEGGSAAQQPNVP